MSIEANLTDFLQDSSAAAWHTRLYWSGVASLEAVVQGTQLTDISPLALSWLKEVAHRLDRWLLDNPGGQKDLDKAYNLARLRLFDVYFAHYLPGHELSTHEEPRERRRTQGSVTLDPKLTKALLCPTGKHNSKPAWLKTIQTFVKRASLLAKPDEENGTGQDTTVSQTKENAIWAEIAQSQLSQTKKNLSKVQNEHVASNLQLCSFYVALCAAASVSHMHLCVYH